eukprot:TRINITY_DN4151_c0_g1_i1.p1 TRINITY_DN4151_c0_g1~~TRINITY_DN4151_c0_g1_i1.p1  ORF type:complete len:244 (+),score=47.54 TRINITY_DN4151_c0_g1_i1:43-732(+)
MKELHKVVYKFDSTKREGKLVWIYKNECKHHGALEKHKAMTQGIPQIAVNDNIEFAMTFYTAKGLADLHSIKWLPPILESTPLNCKTKPRIELEEDKAKKVFSDLSRVCELEDSEAEWLDFVVDRQLKTVVNFRKIRKWFRIERVEYSDASNYAVKIQLRARKKCRVTSRLFGIGINILNKGEECTNEVKKLGLWIERNSDIELRIGDLLIFYYSKSLDEYSEFQSIPY